MGEEMEKKKRAKKEETDGRKVDQHHNKPVNIWH